MIADSAGLGCARAGRWRPARALSAGSRRSSRATETLSSGAAACNEPPRAGMLAGERGGVSEVSTADHRGYALSAGGHLQPADACRGSVAQVRVPASLTGRLLGEGLPACASIAELEIKWRLCCSLSCFFLLSDP